MAVSVRWHASCALCIRFSLEDVRSRGEVLRDPRGVRVRACVCVCVVKAGSVRQPVGCLCVCSNTSAEVLLGQAWRHGTGLE